jgi:PAS domain S-box-containing protein
MLVKEYKPSEDKNYSSTTDEKGIICSVTEEFAKISGYTQEEMIGQNHNILRDPSMPKIIFSIMWKTIENKKTFVGFIKNRTRDGKFYWMAHKVHLFSKGKNGACKHLSYKTPMSTRAKHHMTKLYENLLEEERKGGVEASHKYLKEYLDYRGVSFNEYMETFVDAGGLLKVGFFMARKLLS